MTKFELVKNGQTTVVMPRPELGDTVQKQKGVVVRKSMSGQLHSYIKGPSSKYLHVFTFKDVPYTTVAALRVFLVNTAGQQVTLDLGTKTIVGYIDANSLPANVVKRGEYCDVEITFYGATG